MHARPPTSTTAHEPALAHQPHGIMLHHFHGANHRPSQGSISADDFERLLDGFEPGRILPAREFQERAERGALSAGHLCLTFDDNLRCQFEIALPVLRRRGLTAFWFVATSVLQGHLSRLELYRRFRHEHFPSLSDFYQSFFQTALAGQDGPRIRSALSAFAASSYLAEFPFYSDADRRFRYLRDEVLAPEQYQRLMDNLIREHGVKLKDLAGGLWMNDDCLWELANSGHVIGLHSHTHPTRLASLPLGEQRREYRANHAYLTSLLGAPPRCVSHPCNSYDEGTLRILRELGVTLGFRANMAQRSHEPLEYPRQDHALLVKPT